MTISANDGIAIATWGIVETAPASPSAPTVAAAQQTTTSIRVTITDGVGVTNRILYRPTTSGTYLDGGNRSGNGTVDITSLTTGVKYYITAYADDGGVFSVVGNEVSVTLTDGDIIIEKGLYAYLSNESGITDIVSTRIFPMIVPQGQNYPAITYDRTSGDHEITYDGAEGLVEANFILKCWAATYAGAKDLADALRLVLDGFGKSTMGSVTVNRSHLSDDSDMTPEYEGNTSNIKAYGVAFDLQIYYQETPAAP